MIIVFGLVTSATNIAQDTALTARVNADLISKTSTSRPMCMYLHVYVTISNMM